MAELQRLADTSSNAQAGEWLALRSAADNPTDDALHLLSQAVAASASDVSWIITDAALRTSTGDAPVEFIAAFQPDPSRSLLQSGFSPFGFLVLRASCLAQVLEEATEEPLSNWRRFLTNRLLGYQAKFLHLAEPLLIQQSDPAIADTSLADETPGDSPIPKGLVSIIIPTRDQVEALQRCLECLFEHDAGAAFEIVIVSHDFDDRRVRGFIDGLPAALPGLLQVVRVDAPFNFSALCNTGAARARGDFLLFMNDDVAVLHPGWLAALLRPLSNVAVGITSPRLVFPDGRLQHAGIVLGLNGAADFPFVGMPMDADGYLGLLKLEREVSAVTGACMLMRRSLFDALSGFDTHYAMGFADVDLCIRATLSGQACIWTPHSTLMHEAGRTLKSAFASTEVAAHAQARFEQDRRLLMQRWLPQLAHDPYYNPRLSLTSRQFEPERNPALQPFGLAEPRQPRVFALPADDSGSGEYRVAMPAREAARLSLAGVRMAGGYPLPVLLERLGISTLFSQRQVDDNHLQALRTLRDLMPHLRIVMDFDDLLTGVSRHNIYHQSIWKDMPRRLGELARLSDCFTVSTEPLAAAMRKVHEQVLTIHNGIDPAQWTHVTRASRDHGRKLRVGWVGGYSHAGDLALIREVVATLSDEVDWIMLGMCLEETKPYLKEFHPAVPYAEYPAKFASLDLDLALAPLEITHFNECKSNLRLLENGILGVPVIATDITPYQCGLPVTRVKNDPASWIRAIRERIGEFDALATEGETLRKAVLADWTIQKMLPEWLSAWR